MIKYIIAIFSIAAVHSYTSRDGGLAEFVYEETSIIEGTSCYRLLNGTHQFGCHANENNKNGVLLFAKKLSDLDDLPQCWRSRFVDYHGSFWIVLPGNFLTRTVVSNLLTSDCVSGLVLVNTSVPLEVFDNESLSHDAACPNSVSDFYSRSEGTCGRDANAEGASVAIGMRDIDWRLQILYMRNETQLTNIRKCYELFNVPSSGSDTVSYPLCGMSFSLFNSAAGSSTICYRRGLESSRLFSLNMESTYPPVFCSPLTGHNIFGWPTPVVSDVRRKTPPKYMLIAARMDSFGVIPEVSPGELSVFTSLIALLATARAVGASLDQFELAANKSGRHVVFAMFNGESFDYIGSSAAVFRMREGRFPLPALNMTQLQPMSLNEVEVIIEPQQIGSSEQKKLFMHVDGNRYRRKSDTVDELHRALRDGAKKMGTTVEGPKDNSKVPSASWHSFARYDDDVQAIVLAPYNQHYEYKRYNSMFDKNSWSPTSRSKAVDAISTAASAMFSAAAAYSKANITPEVEIDRKFIEALFDCMIISEDWFSCDFLKNLNSNRVNRTFDSYAFFSKSTYISVSNGNPLQIFLHWLLVFALGTNKHTTNVKNRQSCVDLSEHQAVYSYDWQPNPWTGNFSCYRSSIQYVELQSPAFDIPNYDLSNSTYSTWAESVYTIDAVEIFLVEDSSVDRILLLIGILTALFSIFIVSRCSESTFIVDEGEQRAEEGEPL